MLPKHGKLVCRECFTTNSQIEEPHPLWRMRDDPAAWGSDTPEVLVLGFSKGSTQTNIWDTGNFNDIPFGGAARNRLDEVLKKIGLLSATDHISSHIRDDEQCFAFGSLVRCSLTRDDGKGRYLSSGQLIVKSFQEIRPVLQRCANKFIARLPIQTRVVVMLGLTDKYIQECYDLIHEFYPNVRRINNVAYGDGNRLFVHVTHPSPGNGHFSSWLKGDDKCQHACKALRTFGYESSFGNTDDVISSSPKFVKVDTKAQGCSPHRKVANFAESTSQIEKKSAYSTSASMKSVSGPTMTLKVIDSLERRWGSPVRSTKKVKAWNIASNFGLVVQIDSQSDDVANVWLPMVDKSITALPLEKRVYAAGEGRHSNTYPSPGLGKGEPAICFKLADAKEIALLMDHLF